MISPIRANFKLFLAGFATASFIFLTTACQTSQGAAEVPPEVLSSDAPQKHYDIRVENLPKPYQSESASRSSSIVAQPKNAALTVPQNFRVNLYAENDLKNPRRLALAPNGDVFVAQSYVNQIQILRDTNNDGVADARFVFTNDVNQPFGMAFKDDYFYVANTDSVVRFKYKSGQTKAEGAPEKLIDLPGKGYNQHWTRNIEFSPDGKKLFISIGSQSNADVEPEHRAAINIANPDGSDFRTFASGLRNPVGMAFNPTTKVLWTAVNERDGLGDDLVPDFLTSVKENAFYGFPFSYLGQNEDPRRKGENPELVKRAIVPEVLFQAHSAALGVVFYDGKMFPEEYRGDAFVAFHGSWNRAKLTGYKIVRVRFKNGQPVGGYDDFLTGWLPDESSREVWGRPVGLLVLPDGSLLVSDDGANKIWRVSYQK